MANQPQTIIAHLVANHPDVAANRIRIALTRTKGVVKDAATLFLVAPATFSGYCRKLGIRPDDFRPTVRANRDMPAFLADLFDAEGNVIGDGTTEPPTGDAEAPAEAPADAVAEGTAPPKRRR